jgi:transposase
MPLLVSLAERQDILLKLFPPPTPHTTRKELTLEQRFFIVGLYLGGTKTAADISRDLHIPVSTIKDTIKGFRNNGAPKLPSPTVRAGRPCEATDRY